MLGYGASFLCLSFVGRRVIPIGLFGLSPFPTTLSDDPHLISIHTPNLLHIHVYVTRHLCAGREVGKASWFFLPLTRTSRSKGLEVGECFIRARLESSCIAPSGWMEYQSEGLWENCGLTRIECVDAPKDRVRVQAAPDHIATIDVGNDITALRAPVALEEARCVISLDGPLRDRFIRVTNCSGESNTISQ